MKKKPEFRLWHISMFAFMGFSLLFLLILWIVVTVFLDDIFSAVRSYESEQLMKTIEERIEGEGNFDLSEIDERYNTRVYLFDEDGNILSSSMNVSRDNSDRTLRMQTMMEQLFDAMENSGETKRYYLKEGDSERFANGESLEDISAKSREDPDQILDVKVVEYQDQKVLILLSTRIYPMDITIKSLHLTLLFGSFAFLLLSVVWALVLSRQLSYPMKNISRGAERIAAGDYSENIPQGNIIEIAEIADTLNQTSRELKVTEDLQHEIIANISHDLRTPLTMIRGYAEVMRDLPGENSPENLQIIIDEADRLSGLINDILYIGRLESAQETPKPDVYSITGSIRGILYRIGKLQQSAGYHFEFREAGHEIIVSADAREIDRVLYNLIGNAVRFIGEDKTVIVGEEQFEKDGRKYVRISVTDHGSGIAEADLPLIWNRYYKSERGSQGSPVGTGLGLTIVKEILELHEAEFGVESTVGRGSTFWFILPEVEGNNDNIS